MNKQAAMLALAAEIKDKDICPELAQQALSLVIGDGSLDAEIMFIGEAPGKKEDEIGLPFVGASGKFLSEMLASVGLVREDIYITNIVKYRPPNNRDPKPAEKEAFWPYLVRQIEIIQPKVIIPLGRHSMGYFLPDAVIGDVHGQPEQIQLGSQNVTVIPLYHPAAALYNGSLRQTLMSDFSIVPEVVKALKS